MGSFNFRSQLLGPSGLASKLVWGPEKSCGATAIMVAVVDHAPCAKIMQLAESILVLRRKHGLKISHKVGRKFHDQC